MSERSLLADAVETFFRQQCTHDDVEAIEAHGDIARLWAETEELGLTLASVPESAGGGGGTLIDAMTVLRAGGRHAVPLPLAETDVLAGWLLADAGLSVPAGPLTVAPVRTGDEFVLRADEGRISGRAMRVPWGRDAVRVAVLAQDARGRSFAALVEPSQLRVVRGTNLAGEPRDAVELDDVSVESFAETQITQRDLMLRGALTRSVLMLGALETVRDLSVGYAKERVQFGRPIASFQAVQHLLAGIARDVAVVRASVELAVTAAYEGGSSAWLEIASAKVVAGRAALDVSKSAHQVHGAIGLTSEYSLSVLTRRLWSWRDEFGTDRQWSEQIGNAALLDGESAWDLVTGGRIPIRTARTA